MDLKVKITTEAELAALKQTQKEIKAVSTEANASVAPVQKGEAAVKELGNTAASAAKQKKTLKDAIQAAAKSIPELGTATLALKNPWVIVAFAIAAAIAAVTKFIAKVKEMEKAIQAFDQLNKAAVPFKAIADANARSADAQADALKRIADESDDAATATDKLISKLDEKAKRDGAERAAERERDEAAINADELTGAITPQEARNRRTALATRHGALDREAAARIGVQKVEAIEMGRRAAVDAEGAARMALPGARAEAKQAEADAAARKENRKMDRAKLDMDEAAARKIIEDGKPNSGAFIKAMLIGVDGAKFAADSQRNTADARLRIQDIATKRADLDANDIRDDNMVTNARKRVTDLDSAQQSAFRQSRELFNRRGDTARTVDADTASAGRIGATQDATRKIQDAAANAVEQVKQLKAQTETLAALNKQLFDAMRQGNEALIKQTREEIARQSTPR